jgi:short-subunit dehydrogenase
VLINNAGILHLSGFESVSLEEVNESMQINLYVALRLSQVRLKLQVCQPRGG